MFILPGQVLCGLPAAICLTIAVAAGGMVAPVRASAPPLASPPDEPGSIPAAQPADAGPQPAAQPTPAAPPSTRDARSPHKTPLPLDGRDGRPLLLQNFIPQPQLRVASHPRSQAKFPVVDVHTHFFHRQRHNRQALADFVDLMDRNQIAVCASLDGKLGAQLEEHLRFLWRDHKDRFIVFANVDWQGDGKANDPSSWACNRPGFADRTAEQLVQAQQQGISGLKVFKQFGLGYRDAQGRLLRIDDPRWGPIWQACGRLGLPVIIHTADPAAFFEPVGPENERWEELNRHPDWSFVNDQPGEDYPSRQELLEARNRVIARHPETQFIGAHMANNAEDLATVSRWLDQYPNLWVEPASRIGELGRQPFTARDFFIRHQDRILFGTDGPWPETRVRLYWRVFETRDEYFPYSEQPFPPQGFWRIYGLGLPDAVLRKLYFENAAKLIPGVAQRMQ